MQTSMHSQLAESKETANINDIVGPYNNTSASDNRERMEQNGIALILPAVDQNSCIIIVSTTAKDQLVVIETRI